MTSPNQDQPEEKFLHSLARHLPPILHGSSLQREHAWNLHRLFVHCHWRSSEDEETIPLAKLRLQFIPEERSLWLGDIEVAEKLRYKGIGRKIVTAVEEAARDSEIDRIRLYSRLDACPFWEQLGYRPYAQTQSLEKILADE